MKCQIHTEIDVVLVCTQCDNTLICTTCIAESHSGHKVTHIDRFGKTATATLTEWLTQYQTLLSQCEERIANVLEEKKLHVEKATQMTEEIRSDGETLHNYVTEVTTQLLNKCEEESNVNIEAIESEVKFYQRQLKAFENHETRLKTALRREERDEIICLYQTLEKPPSDIRPCDAFPGILQYVKHHLNCEQVRHILGNITNITFDEETGSDLLGSLRIWNSQRTNLEGKLLERSDSVSSDFEGFLSNTLRVLSTFRCTGEGVVCIQPISKDDCLVKSKGKPEVKLVHRDGVVKKTVNFPSKQIADITTTLSGKVIITTQQPNCVMQFQVPKCQQVVLFDTHEWTPRYLCTTPSDEILLTLRNMQDMRNVVKKFSPSGDELCCAEYDEEINPIFKNPWRIRFNKNNNTVAVLDMLVPTKLKCIVLLDASLKLRLRYLGHGRILHGSQNLETFHSNEGYYANDILFDDNDNMLVCEGFSKALHLLSPDCIYLRKMFQLDSSPWSLACFRKEELWVGFKDGSVKVYSGELV